MDPFDVFSTYVPHKKIKEIWQRLDQLRLIRNNVKYPTQVKHAFVMGISKTGKSTLAFEYINQNPPYETEEQLIRKIAYCEMPSKFTTKGLYKEILYNSLGVPELSSRLTEEELRNKTIFHLRKQQVELLFLDEFHQIIDSREDRTVIMNTFRYIANVSNIVLVCMGYPSINQFRLLNLQYGTRFEPHYLQGFADFDKDYCGFLFNFQKKLKYDKVPLYSKSNGLADFLYKETLGLPGLTVYLLYEALNIAYKEKNPQSKDYGVINFEVLKASAEINRAEREKSEFEILVRNDLSNDGR